MKSKFLAATSAEVKKLGWDQVDIILVTGDAYVDHPSFGIALIGRWLAAHGYRVAILAQPRHHNADDFKRFGPPRLFFGVTAGNLDSIVANYSGNGRVRDEDSYSPDNNPYFTDKREKANRRRPDRATIRYANLARQAYPAAPIVLGGLEASLRRFVHYDYQQAKLRNSILTDAKADIIVYGMGERAVLEIGQRLRDNKDLHGIAGTCERLTEKELTTTDMANTALVLPSFAEICADKSSFLSAELLIDKQCRAASSQPLLQRQAANWIVQHRPAAPLTSHELDRLHLLPFSRQPHPTSGAVPAYRMIRHSITIVRGCSGNCSYCAISRHQGSMVTSRSIDSIILEAENVSKMADFKGTISDLGGPTANLFATTCKIGGCRKRDCFYPELCKNIVADEKKFIELLSRCGAIKGVKNLFISSGLRMELLLKTPRLLAIIIKSHTPGVMKIAPEHTANNVLRLMHKPGGKLLGDFLALCRQTALRIKHDIHFSPYIISAHPGCSEQDMRDLGVRLQNFKLVARSPQDFTPTPGTISTAMYVSELDRETMKPLYVAKNSSARQRQRGVINGQSAKRPEVAGPKKKFTRKKPSGRVKR